MSFEESKSRTMPERGEGSVGCATAETLLMEQFKAYLDIYKQHFDLYFKGIVLYLAGMGALAGFIFRDKASVEIQITLSVLAFLVSGIALAGCFVSKKWVVAMEINVDDLAGRLGARRFPFCGAKGIIRTMKGLTVVMMAMALVNVSLVLLLG